ncbi:hypothetical protein [Flammeovirga pacifica]|nr:hypothetical protein [Flammeovirga pacifica]
MFSCNKEEEEYNYLIKTLEPITNPDGSIQLRGKLMVDGSKRQVGFEIHNLTNIGNTINITSKLDESGTFNTNFIDFNDLGEKFVFRAYYIDKFGNKGLGQAKEFTSIIDMKVIINESSIPDSIFIADTINITGKNLQKNAIKVTYGYETKDYNFYTYTISRSFDTLKIHYPAIHTNIGEFLVFRIQSHQDILFEKKIKLKYPTFIKYNEKGGYSGKDFTICGNNFINDLENTYFLNNRKREYAKKITSDSIRFTLPYDFYELNDSMTIYNGNYTFKTPPLKQLPPEISIERVDIESELYTVKVNFENIRRSDFEGYFNEYKAVRVRETDNSVTYKLPLISFPSTKVNFNIRRIYSNKELLLEQEVDISTPFNISSTEEVPFRGEHQVCNYLGEAYLAVRRDENLYLYMYNDSDKEWVEVSEYPYSISSQFTSYTRFMVDSILYIYLGDGNIISYNFSTNSWSQVAKVDLNPINMQPLFFVYNENLYVGANNKILKFDLINKQWKDDTSNLDFLPINNTRLNKVFLKGDKIYQYRKSDQNKYVLLVSDFLEKKTIEIPLENNYSSIHTIPFIYQDRIYIAIRSFNLVEEILYFDLTTEKFYTDFSIWRQLYPFNQLFFKNNEGLHLYIGKRSDRTAYTILKK